MNKNRNPRTYVARIDADGPSARRIADLLSEALNPGEAACAAFEGTGGSWQVTVHFRNPPRQDVLHDLIALAAGSQAADTLTVDTLEPRDWVTESLAGLSVVEAGRFAVHGAHDRARLRGHRIGIEIEAALAFGTGHHATTRGCLLALDRLSRSINPRHILDLGTGSGVLAIAAAKLWRRPVLASDIDAQSVEIAAANAHANRVGSLVRTVWADGVKHRQVTAQAPFDLVFANILLAPLKRLAAPLARELAPGATVVLSGLLATQASAAIAAYRSQGLALERKIALEGWVTLILSARSLWPPRAGH